MTPKQYCYDKAAPKGSALYFSVRKLAPSHRDAIVGIFAFYHEIEQVTMMYEDVNTAHLKLNWWRDQVIRIQDEKPSHPVAIFLQETLAVVKVSPLRLIEIIDGLEQNITAPVFPKFEDVVIHIMRTAGVRESLVADVLQADVSQEVIYQAALVIELVHYIQHLHRYVRKDLIYFSQEELQKFHVAEADFREFVTTENIQNLLQFQIDKVQRAYQKVMTPNRKQLSNILTRCKLALVILQMIEAENFKVLENFIDITPLRKWWVVLVN